MISDTTIISFDKQCKGLPVMNAETAWKVGTVADLAIDPIQGVVDGLLLTTAKQTELFLPVRESTVFKETFLLNRAALPRDPPTRPREELPAQENLPERLYASADLSGASVVTEQGQLLGHITEVCLAPMDWQVFYRVTNSWWERWRDGGVYIPARATVRWSRTARRLIVAAGAEVPRAIRSPTRRVIA